MFFSLSPTLQNLVTDTWVKASWEKFIALAENPNYTRVSVALVEDALKLSQTEDDGEINRWLLKMFS